MIHAEQIAALPGHQNPIYTVENSQKPGIFFTGGNDKGVVEWSINKLAPLKVLLPVRSSVYSLHATKNYPFLTVGERSGRITVFNLEDQKIEFQNHPHQLPIFDIKSVNRKNELLTASEDGTVSVWNLNGFDMLYNFRVSDETVRCIAINPDESLVAFGCKDNVIRIYSLEDYSILYELQKHTLPITSLQFSPDGQHLLSGSRDAHLNIWNIPDFSLKESIAAHLFAIYDIRFHPNQPYFATASRDKSIKIWHSGSFKLHKNISREKGFNAHSLSVNKIIWTDEAGNLVSVGDDKMVMIWNIATN